MSSRLPQTTARHRPENLPVLLREAFTTLNDVALARIAQAGHGEVRAAHSAVFQFLDDEGTTVSALAERAQITKQSMAELVAHLERHGYVRRVPDPHDGRAKLVQTTPKGAEVFAVAGRALVEIETRAKRLLGADGLRRLCDDLEALRRLQERGAG